MRTNVGIESTNRTTIMQRALQRAGIIDGHVELLGADAYLRGTAPSYEIKRRASERMKAALPGARIVNEMRVACGDVASDRRLARSARQALRQRLGRAGDTVGLTVRGGIVSLHGQVRDEEQRRMAETAIWDECRVVRVLNYLRSGDGGSKTEEIARALRRYVCDAVNVEPWRIAIDYDDDGVVVLSGEVALAWQRNAIEELLRWHGLVRDVRNGLRAKAAV
jgi:osmotically-inducible protein OsmY